MNLLNKKSTLLFAGLTVLLLTQCKSIKKKSNKFVFNKRYDLIENDKIYLRYKGFSIIESDIVLNFVIQNKSSYDLLFLKEYFVMKFNFFNEEVHKTTPDDYIVVRRVYPATNFYDLSSDAQQSIINRTCSDFFKEELKDSSNGFIIKHNSEHILLVNLNNENFIDFVKDKEYKGYLDIRVNSALTYACPAVFSGVLFSDIFKFTKK